MGNKNSASDDSGDGKKPKGHKKHGPGGASSEDENEGEWKNPCEPPKKPKKCEEDIALRFAIKDQKLILQDSKIKKKEKLNAKQMKKVKKKCKELEKKYSKKFDKGIDKDCMKDWGPTIVYQYLIKGKQGNKAKRSGIGTDSSSSGTVGITVGVILFLILAGLVAGAYFYFSKKKITKNESATKEGTANKKPKSKTLKSKGKSRSVPQSMKSKCSKPGSSKKSKKGKTHKSISSKNASKKSNKK